MNSLKLYLKLCFSTLVLCISITAYGGDFPETRYSASFIHGSDSLCIIKSGNGYKLYTFETKQIITSTAYDTIYGRYGYSEYGGDIVVVRSNGRIGLIDAQSGKEVLSPDSSPISQFSDSVYFPHKPLVWTIGSREVQLFSKPIKTETYSVGTCESFTSLYHYYTCSMSEFDPFEDGVGRISINNSQGREVAPPIFSFVKRFDDDATTLVKIDGKYCVIDTTAMIISTLYDSLSIELSHGRKWPAIMHKKSGWGLVGKDGKELTQLIYDNITDRTLGRPATDDEHPFVLYVTDKDSSSKCGLFDSSGKEVIPTIYNDIDNIEMRYIPEMFCVKLNGKTGLISNSGRIIIPVSYQDITVDRFDEEYFFMSNGKTWGMVDSLGKVLIPVGKFESLKSERFSGNRIFCGKAAGKWAIISKRGVAISAAMFDEITTSNLNDQWYYVARKNETWYKINSKGAILSKLDGDPNYTSGRFSTDSPS